MATLRTALPVLVFTAAACSGSLVDEHYLGEPLITMLVHTHDGPAPVNASQFAVRLGIFWNPHGLMPPFSLNDLEEQPSNGHAAVIPGDLSWSVYDAPPANELLTTAQGGTYALGHPMLYYDQNGNQRYDSGDQLVGHDPQGALLYVPKDLDAQSSPTHYAVSAGYHIISLPIFCGPTPPEPPHDGDCGVPLSSACKQDSDCGAGGVCLTLQPYPEPNGYCAVPEPPTNGCRPKNGQLIHNAMRGAQGAWWMLACTTDADCQRDAVYQCDLSRGACMPTRQLAMIIETPQMLNVCPMPPPPMGGPPGG